MNTAQGTEGAGVQFARNQLLANWLHDQGHELEAMAEEDSDENILKEGEGVEMEEGPGPSRRLNFAIE